MVFRGINRRTRHAAVQALLASVVVYLLYHALQGDRGWFAWQRVTRELGTADALHEHLMAERKRMELRANLLRSDHLDPDMLEERARLLLDFGHPDDLIINLPDVYSRD
jgi:cell division protein FtsB